MTYSKLQLNLYRPKTYAKGYEEYKDSTIIMIDIGDIK